MSKDLKRMIAEIRGALDQYPREQLQEILAWVFKEYVVEGGAAPAQGALAMLDARSELEGLSFAELITWLQLHLDVAELAAFEVDGARVNVRAGARSIPIEVAAAPQTAQLSAVSAQPAPQTAQPSAVSSQLSAQPVVAPTPAPSAPPSHAAPPPAPPSSEAKAEEKKDEAPSSRFSWLEVD